MARARLQGAVRIRSQGLGAVRVRRGRPGDDEGRQLLLPAAEHPPPRDPALEERGDARDRLAGEVQDLLFGETCSQKVTGPSFTRLTCISAPNCPVATRGDPSSILPTKRRNSFSASAGAAALEKLGRRPLLVSAASVNWGTARIWPCTSLTERFILPCGSENMR